MLIGRAKNPGKQDDGSSGDAKTSGKSCRGNKN